MALDSNIVGAVSGTGVEVNSSRQLKVVPETDAATNPSNVGTIRVFGENDNGAITGTPLLRSPEVSTDYRQRVGLDSIWDTEEFNYVAINSSKHKFASTNLTGGWGGGFMTLNNSGVNTGASGAQATTFRHFPILGAGTIYVETYAALSAAMPTNTNIDIGLFLPAAAPTLIPLDGVYFRVNSSGVFGVVNNNGTESTTAIFAGFTPTINRVYKYNITLSEDEVEFWIDDVLYAVSPKPVNSPAPVYSGSLPWGCRQHHTGTTSTIVQLKVAAYTVTVGDLATNRLWSTTMTGQGLSSVQGASGHTQGPTANYVNSTAPASATLSNTAAGYTTLGGQFQFAAVAGAETDYALFSFLNPVATTGITGRNLVVRGVWVDTVNTGAAVATTCTLLQWGVAVGATAVSLATTEGVSTRTPRRVPLGFQSFAIGAAIGAQAPIIDRNLDAPLVVEPGSYLHVFLKMPIGTATASQVLRGVVGINAFWE